MFANSSHIIPPKLNPCNTCQEITAAEEAANQGVYLSMGTQHNSTPDMELTLMSFYLQSHAIMNSRRIDQTSKQQMDQTSIDYEDSQLFRSDHGNISIPSSGCHDSAYNSLSADDIGKVHLGCASNIKPFDLTLNSFFPPQEYQEQSEYEELRAQHPFYTSSAGIFQHLSEVEGSIVASVPDYVLGGIAAPHSSSEIRQDPSDIQAQSYFPSLLLYHQPLPTTEVRELGHRTQHVFNTAPSSCINLTPEHLGESSHNQSEHNATPKAVAFVQFWIAQYPSRFPSDEEIRSLAKLAYVAVEVIRGVFGHILSNSIPQTFNAHDESQQSVAAVDIPMSDSLTTDASISTKLLNIEEIARWVAENPTKCPAYSRSSQSSKGKYRCTLGCGQRFTRKDPWKRHEELTYPQHAWICRFGHLISTNDVLKCTYCGVQNPDMNHVSTMHPKQLAGGACREKSFGWDIIFNRKERFKDHCKNVHSSIRCTDYIARHHVPVKSDFPRQCTLCRGYQFADWRNRIEHLAQHFEDVEAGDLADPSNRQGPDDERMNKNHSHFRGGGFFNLTSTSDTTQNLTGEKNCGRTNYHSRRSHGGSLNLHSLPDVTGLLSRKSEYSSRIISGEIAPLLLEYKSPSETARAIEKFGQEIKRCASPRVSHRLGASHQRPLRSDNRNSLRDMIFDTRISFRAKSSRSFIPESALRELITKKEILQELSYLDARLGAGYVHAVDVISEKFLKVFALLIMVEKSHEILKFLSANITDSQLPFSDPEVTGSSSNQVSVANTSAVDIIKTWSRRDVIDICRDQWLLTAPIFRFGDIIPHYEFDDGCVLPFIGDDKPTIAHGGFSRVWKVKIHPAHYEFSHDQAKKHEPFLVAIKELLPNGHDDFENEVSVLKALSRHNHPHIIDLLATYRKNQRYHLMFPFANGNLRNYWQQNPRPQIHEEIALWVLKQCKAISSGLELIHNGNSTLKPSAIDVRSGDKTFIPSREKLFGRHGDIKAENILWFQDTDKLMIRLVIADFGLTAFHRRATRSRVDLKIGGTPRYEPPELSLHNKVSRAYDIWSLGCLYLEFITWLVGGWEMLESFSKSRSLLDPNNEHQFDTFFEIRVDKSLPRAIIRDSVREWMSKLHEMPGCSRFVHDFLDLIAEHLLVINPKDRMTANALNDHLAQMLEKCELDRTYSSKGVSIVNQFVDLSKNGHGFVPRIRNEPRDSAAVEPIYAILCSPLQEEDSSNNQHDGPNPTAHSDNDQGPSLNYVLNTPNLEESPKSDHLIDAGTTLEQVEHAPASHPPIWPRKDTGPSRVQWDTRQDDIYYWYIKQNYSCEMVMNEMKKQGFHASIPMYKRKFSKWHSVERNWKKYQPSQDSGIPNAQSRTRRIGRGPRRKRSPSSPNTLREVNSRSNSSCDSTVTFSSLPDSNEGIPRAPNKTTIQALIDAMLFNATELYSSYLAQKRWKIGQKCVVEEDIHDDLIIGVASSLRNWELLGPTIGFMGIQKAFKVLEKVIGVKKKADCGLFSLPAIWVSFIRLIRAGKPEIAKIFLWQAFRLAKQKYGIDHHFVRTLVFLQRIQKTNPDQLLDAIFTAYRRCFKVAEKELGGLHLTTLSLWGDFVAYLDGSSINETRAIVDNIKRGIQKSESENGRHHSYTRELLGLALYMLLSNPTMAVEAEQVGLDLFERVEEIRAIAEGELEEDLEITRKDLIQTLGTLRQDQEDFDNAIEYLEEFLHVEIADDRDNLALQKLEECYKKVGELEKALIVRQRRMDCSLVLLERDNDTCFRSDKASDIGRPESDGDDKDEGKSEVNAVEDFGESDEGMVGNDADASGDDEAEKQLLREQISQLQERLNTLENKPRT